MLMSLGFDESTLLATAHSILIRLVPKKYGLRPQVKDLQYSCARVSIVRRRQYMRTLSDFIVEMSTESTTNKPSAELVLRLGPENLCEQDRAKRCEASAHNRDSREIVCVEAVAAAAPPFGDRVAVSAVSFLLSTISLVCMRLDGSDHHYDG